MSRFRGEFVKMIRDVGSKSDENRIRQIRRNLLHWGYELTEKYFLMS